MVKIDKLGIWFNYEEDKLCLIWFWHKPPEKFLSHRFSKYFSSLKDYLKFIGSIKYDIQSKNILGFSYEDIIQDWVYREFPRDTIVLLMDINVGSKPDTFWDSIPHTRRILFSEDIVVLRCKDISQLKQVIDSIDINFADAQGYSNGKLIYWNHYDVNP